MLQSRRGFLIGAGSLLTTAFVEDARAFVRGRAGHCWRTLPMSGRHCTGISRRLGRGDLVPRRMA